MKVPMTFRFDGELLSEFRRVSKSRGHTMTWYLEGCMRQVIGRKTREEKSVIRQRREKKKSRGKKTILS